MPSDVSDPRPAFLPARTGSAGGSALNKRNAGQSPGQPPGAVRCPASWGASSDLRPQDLLAAWGTLDLDFGASPAWGQRSVRRAHLQHLDTAHWLRHVWPGCVCRWGRGDVAPPVGSPSAAAPTGSAASVATVQPQGRGDSPLLPPPSDLKTLKAEKAFGAIFIIKSMFNRITVQEKIQNWNVEIGRKQRNQTDTDTHPLPRGLAARPPAGEALPGVNNSSAVSPSPGDRGIALKPRARAASGWAGADTELSREGRSPHPRGTRSGVHVRWVEVAEKALASGKASLP